MTPTPRHRFSPRAFAPARLAVVAAVAASLALGAGPAAASGSSPGAVAPAGLAAAAPADDPADIAKAVVKAINEQRTAVLDHNGEPKRPMKPLTELPCTAQQAAGRVVNMNSGQWGSPSLSDVRAECKLHSQATGNVGPPGANGAAIVNGWMSNTSERENLLGAYTHVGVACSNKNTKPGEWLCEAIFSNPVQPEKIAVTIFGDSYTAGNGVGGGDNKMDWRGMSPWDSSLTHGKKTTTSYQSSKSQGQVLAGLVTKWTGKPTSVEDYSHTGSITASQDSKPLVVPEGTLPVTRMRQLMGDDTMSEAELMKLLDDPSKECGPKPSWVCGRGDGWSRKDVSTIMTLEEQINEALEGDQKVIPKGEYMIPQGVIVVGAGGNDIAFARIAEVALVFPFSEKDVREALASAQGLMEPAMVRAEEQITRLIMNASPNTVILVQGYPYLANAEGSPTIYGCKKDEKFVDAQLYCSGEGVLGNQGTKTQYQPAGDLRAFQEEAEDRYSSMVRDLAPVAKQYGVEIRFVPYASATDGQASYLANGRGNPNRGITTGFEVGDDRTFTFDQHHFIHPTARLRSQEGNLLFQSLLVSDARHTFLADVPPETAERYAPKLTTPAGALPAGTVKVPYSFFLTADGIPAPKYEITGSGRLPDGMILYRNGVLGGVPDSEGDYTFEVTVETEVNSQTRRDSAVYSIHVGAVGPDILPALVSSPESVPTATVGGVYTFTPEATGFPLPMFSIAGELPPGMYFSPATGTVSGTPALPGDYAVTITAYNTIGGKVQAVSQTYTFHVDLANTPPEIVSDAAPEGTVGAPYGFTVRATGSPAPTFAVTDGELAPGLDLDPVTGNVSGTPTAAGEYAVTITASNTVDGEPQADSAQYTIVIVMPEPEPPVVTVDTVPAATVGVVYSLTIEATGDPDPTFAITDGELPPGLDLDAEDGTITGVPTEAGVYVFTVTASNAIGSDSVELTIEVAVPGAEPVEPVITLGTVPVGTVGAQYVFTVEAIGDPAPTFEVTDGELPLGLSLDPATGTISGLPAVPGSYTVTITASNTIDGTVHSASVQFNMNVELPTAPAVITSGPAPAGTVGVAYTFTVAATGNPAPRFEVTDGELPPGLDLDPATGALTGVPAVAGDHVFTVTASNTIDGQVHADEVELTVVVDEADPDVPDSSDVPATITAGAAPTGTVGAPYTFTVDATGSPAPVFEITEGNLPPGLVLDATTGTVSGTPALPGDFTVTITASNTVDGEDCSDSAEYTIAIEVVGVEVTGEEPVITSGPAPGATVGAAYTFTVRATGKPAPVFEVTDGDLPAGLVLDATTGTISGTPTADGEHTVTVTASNT
ncbi:MAG: putative Ig domain-containing protein, partial [Micrococcales bacterium]|nr:putative Ig domain-containing protein [Micrococcales bacterium]